MTNMTVRVGVSATGRELPACTSGQNTRVSAHGLCERVEASGPVQCFAGQGHKARRCVQHPGGVRRCRTRTTSEAGSSPRRLS